MSAHMVLGGNGVVGRETTAALLAAGHEVASLSRSGSAPSGARPLAVDLRDASATLRALEGARVAYLTVGVPYSAKVWRQDWPTIMQSTIGACLAHGIHLVYFDNVYAYGRVDGPMTEATPIAPCSKKGEVRAALVRMLEVAAADRGLRYTIGRSADFYGPGAGTSVFNDFVIDKVVAGRAATWLFDSGRPHSMTYTPDIGKSLAVLGTDDRAWGRTWHLPTSPALSGEEYLDLACGGAVPRKTMSTTTMRLGALFIGVARETLEMRYQYTAPYVFDSRDFEGTFGIAPTPYAEGVAASLENAAAKRPAR